MTDEQKLALFSLVFFVPGVLSLFFLQVEPLFSLALILASFALVLYFSLQNVSLTRTRRLIVVLAASAFMGVVAVGFYWIGAYVLP